MDLFLGLFEILLTGIRRYIFLNILINQILITLIMGNLLDRKKLLAKEKFQIVKVDLDKDEYIFVRQMSGHERDKFESSLVKEVKGADGKTIDYERSLEDLRAKLCVMTICDEKGNLLLEPSDYPVLSQHMSAARLEKIMTEAQKLNKISEDAKELLTKNLEADQVGSSNSDSVES